MSNDFVSIVIPVFNRERLIAETVNSVLKQDYDNWELLLIDDGSTDSTLEIINNFSILDSRIKYFQRSQLPKGAQTCRNLGIQKATGTYIMFMDSDDLLATFCLGQRVAY